MVNKKNKKPVLPSTNFSKKSSAGFIALTSLLVISAVVLSIAVSISLLGISQAQASLSAKKGEEVLKIAESCAEEALIRLRDNAGFSGGDLTVGNGLCTMTVVDDGNHKVINIEAELTGPPNHVKRLEIRTRRTNGSINIVSWQQVE